MNTASLYRALHLEERKGFPASLQPADLTMAIPYWRKLLNLEGSEELADMLKRQYGLSLPFLERHFEWNLSGEFRYSSDWLSYIESVFQSNEPQGANQDEEFEQADLSVFPYYSFFEPFVREFYYDFFYRQEIQGSFIKLAREAVNEILKYYLDQLYTVAHKTLILEINYLRMEEHLKGDTPEQRYQQYVGEYLKNGEYREALLGEYPVLFRLIAEKTSYIKNMLQEMVVYCQNDWDGLQHHYQVSQPEIVRLHLGQGDSHQKGRTVTILEFRCGKKVVLKPRNMSVDDRFQSFIHWLNEQLGDPAPLRTVKTWNRVSYGWMEYVDYQPLEDKADIVSYYYRLGKLLAVLHTMNATDFHYENIIANGEHPVLIDLESLFHHPVTEDHDKTESHAINKALEVVRNSVLSTGVIPMSVDQQNRFDISGIGGQQEQQSPFKVSKAEKLFTDEAALVRTYGIVASGQNHPFKPGQRDSTFMMDLVEQVNRGFSEVYRFFEGNKEKVEEELLKFKHCEIRRILKSTMKYARLLHLSYHPDFLKNQIDRELLLNRLSLLPHEVSRQISASEVRDLLQGDIPYFRAVPGGTDLFDSEGQVIRDFYYQDGLSASLRKLRSYSEEDLGHQTHIIQSTISALYAEEDIKLIRLKDWRVPPLEPVHPVGKAELLADVLIRTAIKHQGELGEEYCWTGMVTKGAKESQWVYSITGPGLYDGNTGIALFFAQLWRLTRKEVYKQACYATMRPLELVLKELIKPDHINIGAYLGLGGMAYTFYQLGRILAHSEWKQTAIEMMLDVPRLIPQDQVFDLIGGSAGALLVISRMLGHEPDKKGLMDVGNQLVKHLLDHAHKEERGTAWLPANGKERPYIGFSHGHAGILFALSCFYPYSNQPEQIVGVVEDALRYENQFFSEEHNNWYSEHLQRYSLSWCHGAPGILLSRMELSSRFPWLEGVGQDRASALATTIHSPTGKNYSLCHGDLGNLDILLLAKEAATAAEREEIARKQQQILGELFYTGNDIKADINAVGVMNGLASIGYGLLRIQEPESVPSLLTLDMV